MRNLYKKAWWYNQAANRQLSVVKVNNGGSTFLLDPTKHFLSRMNEARYAFAGAHHPQLGFLVSGGSYAPAGLSSSELSTDGASWVAFTPLPIGLYSHCMVALDGDDGEFFLAGGRSSKVFIHRSHRWDEVEPMPNGRHGEKSNYKKQFIALIWRLSIAGLMCGPVRDGPGGKVRKIIAAGGCCTLYNNMVEVYDISLNSWETGVYNNDDINGDFGKDHSQMSVSNFTLNFSGTSLPRKLWWAAVVDHGDSFNIIGGYWIYHRDQILKYDTDEGQWIELQTTMSEEKRLLTAIKVKSTFFKSC